MQVFLKRTSLLAAILVVLIPVGLLAEGQGESGGSIRISMGGSTTMDPIMQIAIETYLTEVDPNAELSYDAPGSTAGISGVAAGTYELGASSRGLVPSERQQGLVATPIAIDGLAIIVHETVPLDDISVEDAAAIFVGDIRNWSELGGPNQPITVVNRDEASGTLGAFKVLVLERVYGDDARFIRQAIVSESDANLARIVTQTPYSIGYASQAVVARLIRGANTGAKALTVNGIEDSFETVLNGTYPIVRPLQVVTFGEPRGEALVFLNFLRSPRGQQIVEEAGFIPLR